MPPKSKLKWTRLDPTASLRMHTKRGRYIKRISYSQVLLERQSTRSSNTVTNVSLPPSDIGEEIPIQSCPGSSQQKKKKEVQSWVELRSSLFNSCIEMAAVPDQPICNLCQLSLLQNETYRCLDCNYGHHMCLDCVYKIHTVCKLHIIERWQEHSFVTVDIQSTKTFAPLGHVCTSVNFNQTLTLIDGKGRVHQDCQFSFCKCWPEAVLLFRHGFWPLTPTLPRSAVSTDLLDWHHFLTLESQVSAKSFVAAIKHKERRLFHNMQDLEKILKGEAIVEYRNFLHKIKSYPLSTESSLKCPACPKEKGKLFISMDANFGLVSKANSGSSHEAPQLSSSLFLSQADVDTYVSQHETSSKKGSGECSTFQAGDVIRAKNKTKKLTYTGVFGAACRHEIPLRLMNMRFGERIAYPMYLLNWIRENTKDKELDVFILYDIACVLQAHLQKEKETDLIESFSFAIPIFHCYGHKGDCQVNLNPRRKTGFALTDGEQLERLWSYLRLFSRITKEQTPNHRADLLTLAVLHYTQKKVGCIEKNLADRMAKAATTLQSAGESLQSILDEHRLTSEVRETNEQLIQQWTLAEKVILTHKKKLNSANGNSNFKDAYYAKLAAYYALRNHMLSDAVDPDLDQLVVKLARLDSELKVIEKKNQIGERWTPLDSQYLEASTCLEDKKKLELLFKMRKLCVERLYIQDARKRYSDGQMIASRLMRSLKRTSSSLNKLISTYNGMGFTSTTSNLPNSVQWEIATNPSADFYNAMETKLTDVEDSTVVTVADMSIVTRRRALDAAALLDRAKEEQLLLQSEMLNLIEYYLNIHTKLSVDLSQLSSDTNPDDLLVRGKKSFYVLKLAMIEQKLVSIKTVFNELGQNVSNIPVHNLALFENNSTSLDIDNDSDDSSDNNDEDVDNS